MTEKPVALPSLPNCPDCGASLTRRSANMVSQLYCMMCESYKQFKPAALPSSPAPAQPQLFRTKPVEKWAIQWDGSNTKQVLAFIGDGAWYTSDGDVEFLQIETLEGRMRASIWDWIIKGVNGEFYPCKPDIFAINYEPAGESVPSTPSPASEDLVRDLARELYDRFVMGGWEPQDAYPMIREILRGVPSTPVETRLCGMNETELANIEHERAGTATPVETPLNLICWKCKGALVYKRVGEFIEVCRCCNVDSETKATSVETASPMQRCEKWLQKIAEKNPAGISDQYVNAFREGYQFAFKDAQLELTQVREDSRLFRAKMIEVGRKADEEITRLRSELEHANKKLELFDAQFKGWLEMVEAGETFDGIKAKLGKAEAENKQLQEKLIKQEKSKP